MLPGATGKMSSGTLLLSEENVAAGCRISIACFRASFGLYVACFRAIKKGRVAD